MCRPILICLLVILSIQKVTGQNNDLLKYAYSTINDTLRKNENVIFRLDELSVEMKDPSGYTEITHQIKTILNDNAANHLKMAYAFDKHHKIEDLDILVYNSMGQMVKKYKKKDFSVTDAYDWNSIEDYKIMELEITSVGYPCSVEIIKKEYVTSYHNFPSWAIGANTEEFRYSIKIPENFNIHYKTSNFSITPLISHDGSNKIYIWECKNVKAKNIENNGYRSGYYKPVIEVVPDEFICEGYKGSLKTWKEFGTWSYPFYQEKAPFSAERIAEVKSMVDTCHNEKDKIRLLYDYVKKNTRYVSIQLGIGGFKPFSAKFVEDKKYGDCKALTNYMKCLLEVAGIKSYPAIINAIYDNPPADPDFPSNIFNHVILCVPGTKDTTWLECTAKYNISGFLGSFTEDRYALLITENGGVLVKTPNSNSINNGLSSKTEIFLNADGSATSHSYLYAFGDILDMFKSINQNKEDTKRQIFINYLNFKSSESFRFKDQKDSAIGSAFEIEQQFEKGYDFKAGNKYFLPQRVNELCSERLNAHTSRSIEYVFEYPYHKEDSTIYHLPTGFSIDNIPDNVEWGNEYASYKRVAFFNEKDNSISIKASLLLKKRIIPASDYLKVAEFFIKVIRDEDQKIVLKKNG